MKLDKYKQAIADEYIKTRNNIFVSATAGSGKTTLLVHLMGLTPPNKKPLFTAFNKSIAEELKNRVPSTVKVGTIHSLAMGVIRAKYNCNFEVKELKEFIVAKECLRLSHMPPKNRNAYIFEVCEVYNLCLLNLVEDTERFKEICDQYGYLYSERLEKDVFTLKKENTRRFKEMKPFQKVLISFTDMLWVANTFVEQKYWNKYDVLFMDEIQDFNPLHKEIAFKFLKKGGRFVAVGDDKQTIYSFQGSNLNSFNAIKSIPNTVSLPLSVTYRCAENIVNEALMVFEDGIEAAAGAAKGIVYYGDYMDAKPGDFILCRNNFPLFTAFTYLLQANKKAHIIGKDFEKGLCKLVEQINYISDLDEIRDEKLEKLRERGVTRPEFHPAYVQYMELYNIIKFLYGIFGSLDKVLRTIRNAFNSNNGGIKLSTIHKAKGLEADRVFFLDPELIPSPYALTELEQYNERCLEFVAITRAKKELVYCHSF